MMPRKLRVLAIRAKPERVLSAECSAPNAIMADFAPMAHSLPPGMFRK